MLRLLCHWPLVENIEKSSEACCTLLLYLYPSNKVEIGLPPGARPLSLLPHCPAACHHLLPHFACTHASHHVPPPLQAKWLAKHRSARPAVGVLLAGRQLVTGDPASWARLVAQVRSGGPWMCREESAGWQR